MPVAVFCRANREGAIPGKRGAIRLLIAITTKSKEISSSRKSLPEALASPAFQALAGTVAEVLKPANPDQAPPMHRAIVPALGKTGDGGKPGTYHGCIRHLGRNAVMKHHGLMATVALSASRICS
jgi:hypothetical protein